MATIEKPRLIIKRGKHPGQWEPIVSGNVLFTEQETKLLELGSLEFSLTCGLFEEDRFSEDDAIAAPVEIARYPGGSDELFVPLGTYETEQLDQELGQEEIYALLTLDPIKGPAEPKQFKTNVIKRRFRD